MRLLRVLLLLALLGGVLSGCHSAEAPVPDPWRPLTVSNNATPISSVTEVHFSSPQTGWLSGGVDNAGLGHPVLLKTTDGGTSWRSIDLGYLNISRLITLVPVNDGVLYACAPDLSASGPNKQRVIYKSQDGGEIWGKLASNGLVNGSYALYFFDEQVGLSANASDVQKTTDGGVTWRTVFAAPLSGLNKLQVFASGTGYAAGSNGSYQQSVGTLVKTTDRGDSWQQLPWPYGGIMSLSFLTERVGFASTLGQRLYKTVDGGQSWQALPGECGSRAVFVSEQEGFYAAYDIRHTTDGGRSWQVEHALPRYSTDAFSALGFSPAGTGVAVTNEGIMLQR